MKIPPPYSTLAFSSFRIPHPVAAHGEWQAKEARGGRGNILAFLVLSYFGILF